MQRRLGQRQLRRRRPDCARQHVPRPLLLGHTLAPASTPLLPPSTCPTAASPPAAQDYITKLIKGELRAMEATEEDLAKVKPLKKRGKDRAAAAAQGEQPAEEAGAEAAAAEGAEEEEGAAEAHHVLSEAARNSKDAPVGNADVEVPGNEVAEVPVEGAATAPAAAGGRGKSKKRGAADATQQQDAAAEQQQPQKKGRRR
jgi:hypothetical protein